MGIDVMAPAYKLAESLRNGEISSADILEAHIARYEAENPTINAVVKTDLDKARQIAKERDDQRANGKTVGPLHGLPVTIKDVLDVAGLPAISGAPALISRDGNVKDAIVVKAFKDAGAIIWGKTNTPLMAGDVQTYNAVYGVTNNPHDTTRTPGGSSGGAAAALARGITPLEIGSDIGGSLRNPAHYCGVCSLKPTYGLISTIGHVPPSPGIEAPEVDLACVGPMARCVEDLELAMSVLAPQAESASETIKSLSNCRIAIWNDEPVFPLSKNCKDAVTSAGEAAKTGGALVEIARPEFDAARLIDTYLHLLAPIIFSELPKPVLGTLKILRPIIRALARAPGITLANTLVSAVQPQSELVAAQKKRDALKERCASFFQDWDVIIAPVTSIPAPPHNNKGLPYGRTIDVDGKTTPYFSQLDWISLATLCHLPAAVIPVSQNTDELPIGIQIIGAQGQDMKTLRIARFLQQQLAASTK